MKFNMYCLMMAVLLSFAIVPRAQQIESRSYPCKHKQTGSEFETKVIKEINSARINPKIYVERIETYKKYLRGKIVSVPKQTPFMTIEGSISMNEAIKDLGRVSELQKLTFSKLLSNAAKKQLIDLIENPDLGHTGKDGSPFNKRMKMSGIKGNAGENITMLDKTPERVVLRMLIDDGVLSRTHRNNILSPKFTRIGVACGKGKKSYFICVVVFTEKNNETMVKKPRSY